LKVLKVSYFGHIKSRDSLENYPSREGGGQEGKGKTKKMGVGLQRLVGEINR